MSIFRIKYLQKKAIVLSLLLFTVSCTTEETFPDKNSSGLPRISITGLNTAGFVFDDDTNYFAEESGIRSCDDCGKIFYEETDSTMLIGFFSKDANTRCALVIPKNLEVQSYNLKTPQIYESYPRAFIMVNELIDGEEQAVIYNNNPGLDGSITILRNNDSVISGVFQFEGIAGIHSLIKKVSKGRFDIEK